ncbi:hypothetical protein HA402_005941 [Bradysia odoriphaga]|nr:hypothetical protein HA402_005941 [Bradysia odoriphaga]
MDDTESLTLETVSQWKESFKADPKNLLAQNACARNDPFEISISKERLQNTHHMFNRRIEAEGKPVTNQKSSSRCWLFAALNVMRIPFMKAHNIEEFEFSQAYLFYWDKIERSYYFLNKFVELVQRGEKPDGRLMAFLLKNPIDEGGQWSMVINLVSKYGVMPKKYFPETFSCEASLRMNMALKSKLREYARILRVMITEDNATKEAIKGKIMEQMKEVYNIVGICIGIPGETFNWEYYDKTKKYQATGDITPLRFYETLVKPYFNVENKLCLMNDARRTSHFNRTYTVDCLNNVVGGRQVIYNNQPVKSLQQAVVKSILNGEPVWFGCDVGKRTYRKHGILDVEINDFKSLFGVDIQTTLSKEDRLIYGESALTHAMVFTAVHLNENGAPVRYRVENSWGEDPGEKGYIIMTDDWFREFVYEVVVDIKYITDDVAAIFPLEPIVLPAWDPMGTLAQ